jgi:hypothetical protein
MKVVTMIQRSNASLAFSLVAAELRIRRTTLSILDILLSTLALTITEEKHCEVRISPSTRLRTSSSTYTCNHWRGCIG